VRSVCESRGGVWCPQNVGSAWRIAGGGRLLTELVGRGQVLSQDEAIATGPDYWGARPGERVLVFVLRPK